MSGSTEWSVARTVFQMPLWLAVSAREIPVNKQVSNDIFVEMDDISKRFAERATALSNRLEELEHCLQQISGKVEVALTIRKNSVILSCRR